jgi:hypothetical protein
MGISVASGIKSDPVEYRYSFEWLFDLMNDIDANMCNWAVFLKCITWKMGIFMNCANWRR